MIDYFRRRQARDRRIAAIHEAGHAFIAEWEEPRIWPRDIGDSDPTTVMLWGGEILYGPLVPTATNMPRARMAVAGIVAEERWVSDHPHYGLSDQPPLLMRMSDADWLTAERPSHKPDRRLRVAAEQVRALFRQPDEWACVTELAERLIRAAPKSPFEGDVAAVNEQLYAEIRAVLAEVKPAASL